MGSLGLLSRLQSRRLPHRLWSKIRRTKTCWLWLGPKDKDGYGRLSVGKAGKLSVHRIAWMLENGDIAPGLCVLHRCDKPACVRPEHLFLGTQWDNMRDRNVKGRNVVPIRKGGEWTGDLRRVDPAA